MKNALTAKNREQKQFIRSIVEHPITICTGKAGSGKSYTSIGYGAQELSRDKVDRLIISRPLVCTGKTLPALPGGLDEKLDPYWYQCQDYLDYFLGKTAHEKLRQENKIQFVPLELMRGFNFNRTFLVLTEGQNATYEQIKMLLTRIGDDESKIVIDGDISQTDLKECYLEKVIDKLTKANIEEVGFAHLVQSLRHPVVEKIARVL